MQFQLTVEEVHETSSGDDLRMRVIQTRSADAHVFTVDAFRSSTNRYHSRRLQVQILCHYNSSEHFSSTIIFNADCCFGELFQHQSKEKTI